MNLQEFMKLSWGEVSTKVEQAVCKEYENDAYCYIVDMFGDAAIMRFYYYMENGSKLMKINYSCDDNGNITLGDIVEVRVTYEEVVEVSNTATTTEVEEVGVENATEVKEDEEESEVVEEKDEKDEEEFVNDSKDEEEEEVTEESPEEEEDEKDFSEEKDEEEESTEESEEEEEKDKVVCAACGEVEEEEKEADSTADAADVSNAEVTEVEREVSDGNQESTKETNTSSASFTDSERAEFEALKREKKVNLLNSYKENLSEEEFNNFLGSIDSFDEKDLEIELLKAYKASKDKEPKVQRAFAFAPILERQNAARNSLDEFIKNNL